MLGKVKHLAYTAISHNRESPVVRALHKAASFVDGAYRNEGSDFHVNGERRNLERLSQLNFKVALDVGANVGSWSRSAAQAWRTCTVHAFEIAPNTAKKFEDNIKASGLGNIRLHHVGMSDKPGTLKMYYFPDQDELTCSSPRHEGFKSVEFDGVVSTVDTFMKDNHIDHVDYLKVDVEGDEFKVLRGASEAIQADKISCIQFEYGAFSISTRFFMKDYFAMLGEKFVIGKIYPSYVDFSDYSWTMEDHRFCNYLCVSRARGDIIKLLQK